MQNTKIPLIRCIARTCCIKLLFDKNSSNSIRDLPFKVPLMKHAFLFVFILKSQPVFIKVNAKVCKFSSSLF